MRRFVISLILVILLLVTIGHGYSEESATDEPVFAIQEKIFHKYHELAFVTGYNGGDDFYHIYPLGIAYTFHFDDHISWEVARIYGNISKEKDILKKLLDNFGAAPTSFYESKYQILTHLVYRPFYGKDSVLNKTILNHETYFYAGGGFDFYNENFSDQVTGSKSKTSQLISMGAGIKYFINQSFNVAFEVRDFLTYRGGETVNTVWFGVNLGFRFNLGSRQSYSDETISILNGYLKDK
ncbi:MAG: outer membrane beta-barrel domain-containing protein [Proteobacteria bacterium]|nr:outer membrane beta-barrel domain-containing protein [Pseudomonadota bacterium]